MEAKSNLDLQKLHFKPVLKTYNLQMSTLVFQITIYMYKFEYKFEFENNDNYLGINIEIQNEDLIKSINDKRNSFNCCALKILIRCTIKLRCILVQIFICSYIEIFFFMNGLNRMHR